MCPVIWVYNGFLLIFAEMTDMNDSLTRNYILTAGECDAQGRMPLPLVTERIIEAATAHANNLGIGYDALAKLNIGWVLSRLSIEMMHYPGINGQYSINTWIESINRRFSERNFAITDGAGKVAGYARSVWSAIDFGARGGADLSALNLDKCPIGANECPINRTPRIAALSAQARRSDYTFRFCDLDFNRHVNTVRYLELMMDQWDLIHYDNFAIRRVDLLFHHECRFGQTVAVRIADDGCGASNCELVRDGIRVVGARFEWIPR